jgi:hypothetical protein
LFLRSVTSLLIAVLAAGVPVHAAQKPADKLALTRVQDLHYGDVLFHTFLEDDFEALTRLEAYSQWGLMPHHLGEAELLAGGLYLQLGMHNEAGRRFETLLGDDIPASVRGRAWFYLARVWYARGYFDRSVASLQRIAAPLPPVLEAEKQHLLANALMHLGRYDEAIQLLRNWRTTSSWASFARFNLGVALLRSNRLAEGAPFLDSVGRLDSTNAELLALRDKANLALGFAYLQNKQPAESKPYLERVRLEGAQSTRALLGLGWANAELDEYEAALTPWLELRERNLLDAAVQEAYLAVPYAFAKLGASGQAAEYYEQALSSFASETLRIDEATARIRQGSLLSSLIGEEDGRSPQSGWFWQLQELPDAPESRYLFPILAGNDFQEGLKNYRDLAYLGSTLARWDENMVVYSDMIDARESAYAGRIPRVDSLLASNAVSSFESRRKEIEGRFNEVINSGDVAALGTPEQREQWRRIDTLEAALAADPDNSELAPLKEKLRLVRGVLQWDLNQSFRDRVYQQRRELAGLDKALNEAGTRWLRVERARETAPTTTGDFAARISVLQLRMSDLRAKLQTASDDQATLLAGIAVAELEAQKQRIADYEVQARFALATIYDRAAEPNR